MNAKELWQQWNNAAEKDADGWIIPYFKWLESRLIEMEKYSKRWTIEQLKARKEKCVEKCEHEPELIIDYGDGTLHCLHCVADEFWEWEKALEKNKADLKVITVSMEGQVHFPVYEVGSVDSIIAILTRQLKEYEEREASIACAEIEQTANDDIAKRICDENASLTRQLSESQKENESLDEQVEALNAANLKLEAEVETEKEMASQAIRTLEIVRTQLEQAYEAIRKDWADTIQTGEDDPYRMSYEVCHYCDVELCNGKHPEPSDCIVLVAQSRKSEKVEGE